MPTYLNQVPQAAQSLGVTQPLILGNFTTIDAAFQQDHVPYTLSGQGKHNQVTLPVRSNSYGVPIAPPDGGFYTALDTFSGANQVFAQNPVTGATYPVTASSLVQNGWCYLPAGLIIQWGITSFTGTTANVIFTKPFVSQTLSITATLTFPAISGTIITSSVSKTGFTATTTSSGNFYWIALGN
jgi:hypothetical protein